MGETAELEKLHTLEARLAAALDRIAAGLGEGVLPAPLDDPGLTSAELEDALIRAQSAEARLAELEARLAVPAPPPTPAADPAALEAECDSLRAALAEQQTARQAEQASAAGVLAMREADIARLQHALAEARAQAARVADLEARLAQQRAEIRDLQALTENLLGTIGGLRDGQGAEADGPNRALVAELDGLRKLRASEAAELDRILADLDRPAALGGMDA